MRCFRSLIEASIVAVVTATLSLTATSTTQPASARTIEGGVSLDVYNDSDAAPVKPNWINGNVFSNEDMVLYSYYRVPPLKKEWRWEIPKKGYTNFKLKPTIVKHWKGFKPEGESSVTVEPLGPGRFRFYSARPDGPHGYLERIGTNEKGFPRYRFWFDELVESEPKNQSKDASTKEDLNDAKTKSTEVKEELKEEAKENEVEK